MSAAPPPKPPRVLACVLCQNRKIKCDRNSPCSNCVKSNVTCTPSTPAPARKRRRPNQDLQQRLARCEELLSQYANAKPDASASDSPSPDEPWKPLGKLVVDDGGVKFMDSFLWANIHDELSAMRDILENEDKEAMDDCYTPAEPQSPDQNAGLVLSDGADVDLEALHSQPAHAFQLWQTFLERVHPLTKVIHMPTVQPLLVEAATSRANLPKNAEALLFSIYLMATVAMDDSECLERLGYTRTEACSRFSKGCRTVLMRIGILKNYDLVVLQALVLYQYSLAGRYDRHAAWILNGVIVRIAQKMGLHRDGEHLGLCPFETEMRRRIWWQIILLDAIYAVMSGLGQSLLPQSWDTKKPVNVNDSDLHLTMSSVQPKDGPTDMVYCLVSYEVALLMTETPSLESLILHNDTEQSEATNAGDVERARRRIDELDKTIGDILEKYGDVSLGPVHEFAFESRSMLVDKMRYFICPPREQPEWGVEVRTAKDNLFKIAIATAESSLKMYKTARVKGFFLWFLMAHFQIEVLIYMVGQLTTRTAGQLVDRAWVVIELFYHFHEELYDLSYKPHTGLAIFAIRAWKARDKALRESGQRDVRIPDFILKLQSTLPMDVAKHIPADEPSNLLNLNITAETSAAQAVVQGTTDVPWEQMLGFMDTGPLEWEMFGGGNAQFAPNYTNYGTSFGNQPNGWM
ncbi:fungal-specific transcription factor domain-containing protein [Xylariomycetidae sp. FL0641]|nr:fungal-specific transcription factor domain-containing protein [Xylariomycetidae sp. FL0641]